MNEPAIRLEEQIISLFPDKETLICQGWILKKMEGYLYIYPLYYKSFVENISDNIHKCEEISRQCGLACVFRIVEHTNYHLSSILTDRGYEVKKYGVVGEWNLPDNADRLWREKKMEDKMFWEKDRNIGIRKRELLLLQDRCLPDTPGPEAALHFALKNGITQILADISKQEVLPEQYEQAGFYRRYLYRCYQKQNA